MSQSPVKLFLVLFSYLIILSSPSPIERRAGEGTVINEIGDKSELQALFQEPVIQLPHENGKCVFVKTDEGLYSYTSPGRTSDVCGLYLISKPDQVVELEFEDYTVRSCSHGSLVSVINGWELNGQFFPGMNDFSSSKESRYHQFCEEKPSKIFTMDQNVGLVMFRLPHRGDGFKLRVRFKSNDRPCNVILQDPSGVYTLRNYGRRINCTASIMFPESFRMLSTSIGSGSVEAASARNSVETGLIRQCRGSGSQDYVELRGGDGLDPASMEIAADFCGVDSLPAANKIDILCGNTAIRLVSSGMYQNSVTFSFDLFMDPKSTGLTCAALLENL